MEFLNIGTGELVLLVLLGILLVGPRRTVELIQQAGRFLARIQREWSSVRRDVMAEVQALKDETLGDAESSLQEEWQQVQQDMKSGVRALQEEVLGEVEQQEALAESPASALPDTVGPGEDKAG